MARPYLTSGDRADPFRALAHPWRRAIVDYLRQAPMSFSQLQQVLPVSQATLSAHLRILREAGVILPRRNQSAITFHLNPQSLNPVTRWLNKPTSKRRASA